MHLPFGGENRNLGWNLLPGGFVSPSGLGPEKVPSAVLFWFFFSPQWKIPPVSQVDFIAVFAPVAKTLVSSPSAGPRTVIAVFPRQLVAASGFRIKSETRPLCLRLLGEGGVCACSYPSGQASRFAFQGWSFGAKRQFWFCCPGCAAARGLAPGWDNGRKPGAARSSLPLARHRILAEPRLPPLPLLPCYFHRIVRRRGRMFPAFFLFASKGCGVGREGRGFFSLAVVQ